MGHTLLLHNGKMDHFRLHFYKKLTLYYCRLYSTGKSLPSNYNNVVDVEGTKMVSGAGSFMLQ
jgi:hypothetical protein